ncbi:hypothetical protein FMK98_13405 [Klebsiella oxytoca]|uniref:hypothetical protein n=1 Tax=Klebsiella oxytoca TaxID=571 RepID=UPI001CCB7043|nr:hypothetical protein [Klebsiella oxytoca]MBZ7546687.1 hypothetical protein [Klebsiella oxytoca]
MSKFTAKEVALAFMQANGKELKVEQFLVELLKKEAEFEELLSKDDLEGFLKDKKARNLKKLCS